MRAVGRTLVTRLSLLAVVTLVAFVPARPVAAAVLNVTNNHDAGGGSLRQAIAAAAAAGSDDTITVKPGVGTITLASPISFVANGALTIDGNGVKIDANGKNGGILETGGTGALTLDHVTITGAHASGTRAGALVTQGAGDVTLSNCAFSNNTATGAAGGHSDSAAVVFLGHGTLRIT